jgi:predicted methyltransferase
MCTLEDYKWMSIEDPWLSFVKTELVQEWHEVYTPPEGFTGRVLDLGAGCGETANFYLLHGAQHVLCVEPDQNALAHLYKNYGKDPRVTIVPEGFDLVKMDVEGKEENMIVECHFPPKVQVVRAHRLAPGDKNIPGLFIQEYLRIVR